MTFGVAGRYKLEAFKQDADGNEIAGTRRVAADWFNNVITNKGLDMIGYSSVGSPSGYQYMRACAVGSGSAAPLPTDTGLASRIGASATRFAAIDGRDLTVSTARFAYHRMVYRFGPGVGDGNVSEVGIFGGTNDSTGTGGALNPAADMFSRALVLDGEGNPTTVVVLPDETLDVTYELRLYMPNNDVTGNITLNGQSIAYVLRPCDCDQFPTVNQGGWGSSAPNNTAKVDLQFGGRQSVGYGENLAYCGSASAIGATQNDAPTGLLAGIGFDSGGGASSMSNSVYADGNHYIDINFRWELGTAGNTINNAGGIGALRVAADCCSFQIGLTPRPVKTADMIFLWSTRISWARYAP